MIVDLVIGYTTGSDTGVSRIPGLMGATVLSCIVQAPASLVKWKELHVGEEILWWRCEERGDPI